MKFCKKLDNYVTDPTTIFFFQENQSYSRELIKRKFCCSDINFLVLLRISVTQKQEYFSLLIFEAKNCIGQEK